MKLDDSTICKTPLCRASSIVLASLLNVVVVMGIGTLRDFVSLPEEGYSAKRSDVFAKRRQCSQTVIIRSINIVCEHPPEIRQIDCSSAIRRNVSNNLKSCVLSSPRCRFKVDYPRHVETLFNDVHVLVENDEYVL